MEKLVITAAIVGAEVTRAEQPNLSLSAAEIAEDAYQCYKAGAAMIHLHVRDAAGNATQDKEVFTAAVKLIRAKCPVLVQVSTGGAVGMSAEERIQSIEADPDMATLSTGTCNFGTEVFENTQEMMELFAKKMTAKNIKPELECFDVGMIDNGVRLAKKGFIKTPLHFDFVLGVPGAAPGTPEVLMFMKSHIPADATWTVAGVGRSETPLVTMGIILGGHVRVGFEDNVFYGKGDLAKSNAQLVERVVRLAKELGREVATPEEARKILGLYK